MLQRTPLQQLCRDLKSADNVHLTKHSILDYMTGYYDIGNHHLEGMQCQESRFNLLLYNALLPQKLNIQKLCYHANMMVYVKDSFICIIFI